jgi:1,4-alpha-glucan branching enzyme
MHDTLDYMHKDPIYRTHHHNNLTFRLLYAYHENFVLPLSHDEVVHLKGSLFSKMPGDDWQKFANLRLLLGYMFTEPAKKLLFMGGEFAQGREWNHDTSLDWHLLQHQRNHGLQRWVEDLNRSYREELALHELDLEPGGFEWIDANDSKNSVITFLRQARSNKDILLVVCNFTPVPHPNYRVGVPRQGFWKEILNSDAKEYGGAGWGNMGGLQVAAIQCHGRPYSLNITVPPLATVCFKSKLEGEPSAEQARPAAAPPEPERSESNGA